jgi:hypothetical protein
VWARLGVCNLDVIPLVGSLRVAILLRFMRSNGQDGGDAKFSETELEYLHCAHDYGERLVCSSVRKTKEVACHPFQLPWILYFAVIDKTTGRREIPPLERRLRNNVIVAEQ